MTGCRPRLAGYLLLFALCSAGVPGSAWAIDDPKEGGVEAAPSALPVADFVQAADLALQGGRLVEARILIERLDDAGAGNDPTVALLRAELLLALGRPVEAKQILAMMAGSEPLECRVATAMALADIQTGALADAETRLDARTADCITDPVYWRAIGWVALGLGRRAAAAEAYRRALALRPENDAIRNDLAVALIANEQAEEAAGLLASLLDREPRRQDVALNLDYANAMIRRDPVRRPWESDAFWSRRLEMAAEGARRAGHSGFAEALLAKALIERPQHDERLWQQYSAVAVRP